MSRNLIAAAMLASFAVATLGGSASAAVKPYALTCPTVVKIVHRHPTVVYTYRDCGAFVR